MDIDKKKIVRAIKRRALMLSIPAAIPMLICAAIGETFMIMREHGHIRIASPLFISMNLILIALIFLRSAYSDRRRRLLKAIDKYWEKLSSWNTKSMDIHSKNLADSLHLSVEKFNKVSRGSYVSKDCYVFIDQKLAASSAAMVAEAQEELYLTELLTRAEKEGHL